MTHLKLVLGLALPLALMASLDAGAVRAEGLQRDSDDFNCNHGAYGAPRTLAACARLRGADMVETSAPREVGLQRDSDDFNCHRSADLQVRTAACARLHAWVGPTTAIF